MHTAGARALYLTDPVCSDVALVGGKAASLARLLASGAPVPPAFVLPVTAFHWHVPDPDPARAPERIQLEADLVTSLKRICRELCPHAEDRLVVRSSAIGEDGPGASFAGAHETYYYVTADNVAQAVEDCWRSLWSREALAYRARACPDTPLAMAVILQRMVRADRSGVCFTSDPTGRSPELALLESSWGLGAALVDGRVSPDRYWLDDAGQVVERRIARKRVMVPAALPDDASERLQPVPLTQQMQPTLTEAEAAEIAALAHRIAADSGTPQDVEWAMEQGKLYLLQARPITTAIETSATQHGRAPIDGRWVLFKPVAENFSEPLSPMTVDLLRHVLPGIGAFVHGRFYVDADRLAHLLPWKLSDEQLIRLLLMRGVPDDLQPDPLRLLGLAGLLSIAYLADGATWHRSATLELDTLAAFEARCRQLEDDPEVDARTALARLITNDHPLRPLGEFPVQANVSSVRYFLLVELLTRLLRRLAPDYDTERLPLLLTGGEAMLSRQMVEAVRTLADTARSDPALNDTLMATDSGQEDVAELLATLPDDHPFVVALASFMKRFGHRAIRELEFMMPRWREDPVTVIGMVRNYLQPETDEIDLHGRRLALLDELHQSLRFRWQRRLVDHLLERIRYYVTLRENTRHYHTMAMAVVREKLRQLEARLLAAGRLRCPDDIFFLEFAEARALEAGELEWTDVEHRIRLRRRRYQEQAQESPPETLNFETPAASAEEPSTSGAASAGKTVLEGDCACPGVVTGTARVITDPSVSAALLPGEVLIAPYTDPAWTPLFPNAGAIVVEIGSFLSHAGTVAREYGVPCLVDVSGCMRRIRSGDRVTVNASEGWVAVLG